MIGNIVVVYGAGGHGAVVLDALMVLGVAAAGLLDDRAVGGARVLGLPVHGAEAWLAERRGARVALGIGDNAARRRVAERCAELGAELFSVVHPRATVSPFAEIGPGAVVLAGAVVNARARIGRGAIVNSGAVVEHDTVVGDFAHVSPNATLTGGASIGNDAQLGAAACVLPGIAVGHGAVIGAGAVVTRAVAAHSVAWGVPARIERSR